MKKLMNAPETLLADALAGFAEVHADLVRFDPTSRSIFRRVAKGEGKVTLVSGGGSGHEPMHIGYVGRGMLDAACAGQIFSAPTPDQMMAAAAAVDTGAGVLFIVKNYAGDVMNFDMVADLRSGITDRVLVDDDVALVGQPAGRAQGGRGVAGTVVVEKIVGAAAEQGARLEECAAIGRRVTAKTGSMAAALRGCTVPAAGRPTFFLGEGEIELGVGIHGEAGRERVAMKTASELAEIFLDGILDKIRAERGEPLLLMCNGLGATPPIELYSFYHAARQALDHRGYRVERSLAGTFCTALDMAGASLTVTALDQDTLPLFDTPAQTPAFRCS
ncbi:MULTISPECIES: dihydroxyacetone kinase subunit DhaK [unclassified Ensifer]|uniref:dihydroxyacetone kinase subunit DhaK n=1 Tax=unclassified Ensifer TaxID=2633371 RepID=UPI000813022B|nr:MULTISPECIES: dihydroxyacetone kinase subunit DhaK [unclassified Ensifer]OCP23578.1 dihydroxyacetone kinase subunit DhaK [Ensifer sp. LC384]OCP24265.1 dihydroxyacetone kinase subunit DhaK [Ensifer sp. LC54]